MADMSQKDFIYSLQKGLSILKLFSTNSLNLSLSEIAAANSMSIPSVYRYLKTFSKLGYITQNPDTKKFQLTAKILELGLTAFQSMPLRKRVLPYLIGLSKEFETTTACSVLDGTEIIYIERVRAAGLVNLDLSIGSRLPVYCTAMGKAILSFIEKEKKETIIASIDFKPLTPYTITDKKSLIKDLELSKERGYAICNQELNLGLISVGAPIFEGNFVAPAISINLPNSKLLNKPNLKKTIIERLLQVVKQIHFRKLD